MKIINIKELNKIILDSEETWLSFIENNDIEWTKEDLKNFIQNLTYQIAELAELNSNIVEVIKIK